MFTLRINELSERMIPILSFVIDQLKLGNLPAPLRREVVFYDSPVMADQMAGYQRAAYTYDPYTGAGRGPAIAYRTEAAVLGTGDPAGDRERLYVNMIDGLPYNQWTVESIGMDWGLIKQVDQLIQQAVTLYNGLQAMQQQAIQKAQDQADKMVQQIKDMDDKMQKALQEGQKKAEEAFQQAQKQIQQESQDKGGNGQDKAGNGGHGGGQDGGETEAESESQSHSPDQDQPQMKDQGVAKGEPAPTKASAVDEDEDPDQDGKETQKKSPNQPL